MSPSWESVVIGVALLVTMAAYALFNGADFGGGIWDMLAGGSERGRRARSAVDASLTPVWEGNQVWIVLGIVIVWTAYPTVFADVMTSLFIPVALALLGILFRGVGFAFRHELHRPISQRLAGGLFAAASVLAPFFLGVSVGAVATGKVKSAAHGNVLSAWLTPTALVTGAIFVCACAHIGAVFLVSDSYRRDDQDLAGYFTARAILSGLLTASLAGLNLWLLHDNAKYLFHRLEGPGLAPVIMSFGAGAVAVVFMAFKRHWMLRFASSLSIVSVIAAWGVGQYPWLLPGSASLQNASAPVPSLQAELAVLGLVLLLVVPSFAWLYLLQQRGRLEDSPISEELQRAVEAETRQAVAVAPSPAGSAPKLVVAALVAVAVGELLRERLRAFHNR
jgi:cytochrome d ubiquinol oxidase subunit II